jgi:hypothetical protein
MREDDRRVTSLRITLAVGCLAGVVGGCGSGDAGTAATGARVESATCQSFGVRGRTVSQSCVFVLSDGQRFRCHDAFEGQTPTARKLAHTRGCASLQPLKLSATERAMIAALDTARSCLKAKGWRVIGAPVLPPNTPGANMPDGELVITSAHPTFIAFYTNTAKARRSKAALTGNARRIRGQVEPRGAATIIWTGAPSEELRSSVEACLP